MFEVLDIFVPGQEYWDNVNEKFINTNDTVLHLKHSLISLTKWEQKYKRLFLTEGPNTTEETIYYIKCMTMNREPIDDLVYESITTDDLQKVIKYIKDPMTATRNIPKLPKKDDEEPEKLSSELIYCYMTLLNIPFDCEKWHLSNLLVLIELASYKNTPKDDKVNKRSSAAIMKDYAALNRRNRARFNTKG